MGNELEERLLGQPASADVSHFNTHTHTVFFLCSFTRTQNYPNTMVSLTILPQDVELKPYGDPTESNKSLRRRISGANPAEYDERTASSSRWRLLDEHQGVNRTDCPSRPCLALASDPAFLCFSFAPSSTPSRGKVRQGGHVRVQFI